MTAWEKNLLEQSTPDADGLHQILESPETENDWCTYPRFDCLWNTEITWSVDLIAPKHFLLWHTVHSFPWEHISPEGNKANSDKQEFGRKNS